MSEDLIEIQREFEKWRNKHGRARKPFPKSLRRKVIELTKTHSNSSICKALNINPTMIRKWQSIGTANKKKSNFLEIPTTDSNSKAKIRVIDLTGRSGEKLRIEGEFTISDIAQITKAFMETPQ